MSIYVNVLTGGSNNHLTTSENANQIATDFISEGVVGAITNTSGVAPATGAFAVNAQGTPNMTVAVSAGVAYVQATPSGQASQMLRVYNNASANVTIAANSSGSTKYDWVYISISAANAATPNTAGDNVATLVTSRSTSATTDDGTPPTYGYPIAVVTVANGASSITNGNIADKRTYASPFFTPYQSITANSFTSPVLIQRGWGYITGDGANRRVDSTVTFPIPYSTAPTFLISNIGYKSGSNPTDETDTSVAVAMTWAFGSYDISTTLAAIQVYRTSNDGNDPGVLGNTIRYMYSWIAIGTRA